MGVGIVVTALDARTNSRKLLRLGENDDQSGSQTALQSKSR